MRKPFWSDAATTLYLGQATDVIRELPTGSVDCVIISPRLSCSLGSLDVAAVDHQQRACSLRLLFAELRRVVAADGTVLLHLAGAEPSEPIGGGETSARNCRGMPRHITATCPAGWAVLGVIGWDRSREASRSARRRSAGVHETVVFLAKQARHSRQARFLSGSARGPHVVRRVRRSGRCRIERFGCRRSGSARRKLAVACHGKRCGGLAPSALSRKVPLSDSWVSPLAQFRRPRFDALPVGIAARCVAAGCRDGGTVLDLYAGGGIVGVAARRLGRNYIGMEARPEYLAVAARRLRAVAREGGGI